MAIFLSLAFLGHAGAESQPPILKVDKPESSSANNASHAIQQNTRNEPLFVEIVPSQQSEPNTTKEERYDQEMIATDRRMANYTLYLVIGTSILAVFTGLLWFATYRLVKDSKETSKRQAEEMKKSLAIAKQSADAALQAATANKLATRAYVRISSCSPGLALFDNHPIQSFAVSCKLRIHNYGETPAHITDIVIKTCTEETYTPLPADPDYSTNTKFPFSHAFLVRGESIFYYKFPDEISKEIITTVKNGENALYIYGYVDYTDVFENRHRGGFGQRYHPPYDQSDSSKYESDKAFKEPNNLVFLMQDGYNYDRPRKDGKESA